MQALQIWKRPLSTGWGVLRENKYKTVKDSEVLVPYLRGGVFYVDVVRNTTTTGEGSRPLSTGWGVLQISCRFQRYTS